jgi:hypothetical protein
VFGQVYLREKGRTVLGLLEAVVDPRDSSVLERKEAAEVGKVVGLLLAAVGVKEGLN